MNEDTKDNCIYFDITSRERDSAIRYLLGAIVKSRMQGDFPSNFYTFDEDVNVYLAHLLFAVSLPEYHEMAEPYLSMDTSDILNWVRSTEDRTIRYFIFKVNADHILVHTAIFDDMDRKLRNKLFKKSEKHYLELAKLYYGQAAAYHKRIYRKKTGVGEVLDKISNYFEAYQKLLKHVRREYFHFVNSFRDQAFHHFMDQMQGFEKDFQKKTRMDRFLELYAQWLRTKNPALKTEITKVAAELKMVDPAFNFDVNKYFNQSGGMNDARKWA